MLTTAPPQTFGQVGLRLLAALFTLFLFGVYWSPSLVAVVRRHPRLALVLFYNVAAVLAFPWLMAWAVVLAEPSRRPRKTPAPVPADPRVVPFQRSGPAA